MLKFLILLPLLQVAAHVITLIGHSPDLKYHPGDSSFKWKDGCISVLEVISISGGEESSIVVDANNQQLLFSVRKDIFYEPSEDNMTVYIVTEKEGTLGSDEQHQDLLTTLKMYHEELSWLPVGLISEEYLNMNFAILKITPVSTKKTFEVGGLNVLADVANTIDDEESELPSKSFEPGDQVRHSKHAEPLIILRVLADSSEVSSTLNGSTHQYKLTTLKHCLTHQKIPLSQKVSQDGKYKYILRGSTVYYRPKGEQNFLVCKVAGLSLQKPPILQCDERRFVNADWDDMFPIEAADYLPELSFSNNNNNNNNTESSSNILPLKRSTDAKDGNVPSIGRKKRIISMGNFQEQIFERGAQLSHLNSEEPYLNASSRNTRTPYIINTMTGKITRVTKVGLTIRTKEQMIPMSTKMVKISDNTFYKFIMKDSYVLYFHDKANLLYPCRVASFSHHVMNPNLHCVGLGRVDGSLWNDLFPIEAYEMIKDRAKVFGFDGEEVTTEKLESQIRRLKNTIDTKIF